MKSTPLLETHKKLGARIVDFAGYAMPVQYKGVITEHECVRQNVGVFDVSHMGWISFEAPDLSTKLNHIFTKDLKKIKPGRAQYNLMCLENGGTIDDLILYKESEEKIFAVFNASNKEKDLDHIKTQLKDEIQITPHFDSHCILAIQGPKSLELLKSLGFDQEYKFMSFHKWNYKGHLSHLAFTGYTGEQGAEWILPNEVACDAWDELLKTGESFGLQPCGLAARDTLRTEMGYSLYGHELTDEINPISAGLSWAVSFDKDNFIGKDALITEKANPTRKLICLSADTKRGPRPGTNVLNSANKVIGHVSSGTYSPSLGHAVAMALVKAESTAPYSLEFRSGAMPFELAKRPFYTSARS